MSSPALADLPTIFDPKSLTRKGLCPVSSIRNKGDPFESHSLYFEQHGTGPEKVIFIMGCVPWYYVDAGRTMLREICVVV